MLSPLVARFVTVPAVARVDWLDRFLAGYAVRVSLTAAADLDVLVRGYGKVLRLSQPDNRKRLRVAYVGDLGVRSRTRALSSTEIEDEDAAEIEATTQTTIAA